MSQSWSLPCIIPAPSTSTPLARRSVDDQDCAKPAFQGSKSADFAIQISVLVAPWTPSSQGRPFAICECGAVPLFPSSNPLHLAAPVQTHSSLIAPLCFSSPTLSRPYIYCCSVRDAITPSAFSASAVHRMRPHRTSFSPPSYPSFWKRRVSLQEMPADSDLRHVAWIC